MPAAILCLHKIANSIYFKYHHSEESIAQHNTYNNKLSQNYSERNYIIQRIR